MEYVPFVAVFAFSAIVLFVLARFTKLDLDSALKIGGGLATMLALIVGIVEFTVTQRQQGESATQAEYIAATEQLSETGTTRPLAGIAALAQLAQHSPERTWLMTESLSAFVRYTAPRPEEDQQSLSERVPVTLAPYADPPCGKATTPNTIPGAMASSEDLYYNYGTCTRSRPLLQANLSAQAALTSIATRNRDNETESNAPPRFKGMIASTRRNLASESRAPRITVLETIVQWHRESKQRPPGSNRQLLQDNQEAVFSGYPEIIRRPWLNVSGSALQGLEAASGFLEGGNLSRSDLSFGDLSGGSLARVDLSGSWLVGTDLFGADLRGANLQEADLRGADIGRANLRRSWMSGGDFHRANFWEADLSEAFLLAADMSEVETMAGAHLEDIIAYRADFSRATISERQGEPVHMQRAFLEEARFRCAVVNAVDLRSADLQDADFTNAQLIGADLRGANLNGTILAGADLSKADLRGVDLTRSTGVPSKVDGALVNNQTKLPWSKEGTVMYQDLPGFQQMLNSWFRFSTEKSSEERRKKIDGEIPATSLTKLRDACPPQADARNDISLTTVSHQPSSAPAAATLDVVSIPTGGDVELDGVLVGSTPLSLNVSTGVHTLRISKGSYFVWDGKLRISEGTVKIVVELESITQGMGK